jgi:hypothetical protein
MGRLVEAFEARNNIIGSFKRSLRPFVGEMYDEETQEMIKEAVLTSMQQLPEMKKLMPLLNIDWKVVFEDG